MLQVFLLLFLLRVLKSSPYKCDRSKFLGKIVNMNESRAFRNILHFDLYRVFLESRTTFY